MNDIIKISKTLESSDVLIDGASETVKCEMYDVCGGCMLLGTLGASVLGNMLTGKGVLRSGKGVIRVGKGYSNVNHMDKNV